MDMSRFKDGRVHLKKSGMKRISGWWSGHLPAETLRGLTLSSMAFGRKDLASLEESLQFRSFLSAFVITPGKYFSYFFMKTSLCFKCSLLETAQHVRNIVDRAVKSQLKQSLRINCLQAE